MGTKERKERERELRKEQILLSAVELIAEHGFEKTTMDEIAHKAEFSKGTLYLYFKDKAALYAGIKKEALKQLQSRFSGVLRTDLNGYELVMEMLDSFLDFLQNNPVHAHSFVLPDLIPKDDCEYYEASHELIIQFTRAIQIGIQDGSISPKLNPRTMSIQIGLYLYGAIQFFLADSEMKFSVVLKENNTSFRKMIRQTVGSILLNAKDFNYEQ